MVLHNAEMASSAVQEVELTQQNSFFIDERHGCEMECLLLNKDDKNFLSPTRIDE